ncbi:uncharacterized protein LOC113367315 [Ctenocephalides felis]|uniref:uncharacterized protein LOC113367315 n=1 Tax=Ctenocephalides felis TaxID=7515 RepID=UPI000E6E27DB|nr:uncharacterized protein LOC113367315 [Ctenocephalides felis]
MLRAAALREYSMGYQNVKRCINIVHRVQIHKTLHRHSIPPSSESVLRSRFDRQKMNAAKRNMLRAAALREYSMGYQNVKRCINIRCINIVHRVQIHKTLHRHSIPPSSESVLRSRFDRQKMNAAKRNMLRAAALREYSMGYQNVKRCINIVHRVQIHKTLHRHSIPPSSESVLRSRFDRQKMNAAKRNMLRAAALREYSMGYQNVKRCINIVHRVQIHKTLHRHSIPPSSESVLRSRFDRQKMNAAKRNMLRAAALREYSMGYQNVKRCINIVHRVQIHKTLHRHSIPPSSESVLRSRFDRQKMNAAKRNMLRAAALREYSMGYQNVKRCINIVHRVQIHKTLHRHSIPPSSESVLRSRFDRQKMNAAKRNMLRAAALREYSMG